MDHVWVDGQIPSTHTLQCYDCVLLCNYREVLPPPDGDCIKGVKGDLTCVLH